MRLLVTGASGLLGLNLSLFAARRGHTVTGLIHTRKLSGTPFVNKKANLLNTDQALLTIEESKPDAMIHCAAIANLSVAEKQPDLANRLNAEVPGRLAEAAGKWGIPFVHISTDAVFDGQEDGYTETSPTNPLSTYGRTKLAGERAVLDANPDALIARVVFYGWSLSGNRSLSEFFINNLRAGRQIKGFSDNYFCPLYVEDLSKFLLEMVSKELQGIYHVVSPEHISKYAFGVRLARRFGLNSDLILPVRIEEVEREVLRSLNLTLNTSKAQSALGHGLPSVDEGIEQLYQRWQTGYPADLQSFLE